MRRFSLSRQEGQLKAEPKSGNEKFYLQARINTRDSLKYNEKR